jgi:hypothetical protein
MHAVAITRAASRIRATAHARSIRHLTSWVRFCATVGHLDVAIFDKPIDFVLDSEEISPIIYIWYEGGWLSPPVVTAKRFVGG